MSVLRRLFGSESRALGLQTIAGHPAFDRVPVNNLGEVDRQSVLGLTAAYASVRLLADVVSSFPVEAYSRIGGVRRPYRPEGRKPSWLQAPLPSEPTYTFNQLVSECVVSLFVDGNAFLYAPRDESGQVLEVRVLDPRRVEIARSGREVIYKVKQNERGDTIVYTQNDILHVPLITMPGELRGINPVHQLRTSLALGITLENYATDFFRTGSTPTGVIEVPSELSKDQAEALKFGWQRHHTGSNMHTPGVLTGGASFKPLAFQPEDAQLLASRQFTTEEIARMFRVPPNLIGVMTPGAVSYASVEQTNLAFVQYTLRPLVEMLERPLSTLLYAPDAFVKFSMDSLLRGTTQDRFETYRIGLQEGWLSVNDIRKLEDMSPLDGGDSYRMPLNEADANTAMLRVQAEVAGSLVRSGYDPRAAAKIAGLPPIPHNGGTPTTIVQETP